MKAITLWQPWASLVAIGAKRVETRSWSTAYRGPLAIHAAKAFPREARDCWEEFAIDYPALTREAMPFGAIVATCRLVDIYRLSRLDEAAIDSGASLALCPGRIYAVDVTREEARLGHYAAGRCAWVLADVQALPEPIPAKGAMGFWEWVA